MEIIRIHGETGRNESKWGDLLVGLRDDRSVEQLDAMVSGSAKNYLLL